MSKGNLMQKTRAQQMAEQLQKPSVKAAITGKPVAQGRVIQQPEVTGIDKLEKRRAALKKLHDFKNGVI